MATVKNSADLPKVAPARPVWPALAAVGICLFVELVVVTTRGRVSLIFEDFEVATPVLTNLALSWLFPAVLAILIAVGILKELMPIGRTALNAGNAAIALLGIACFGFYVIATLMPTVSLINALS